MGWLALIAGASLVLGVWAFIQGASVFGVLSSLVAAFATRKAYTSRSSREVWQLRPGEASLIAKRDNAIISVNAIIVVHVVFTTTYRDHGMSENVILIDANGVQHSLFSNIADVRGLATVAASALALPLTFRDEA